MKTCVLVVLVLTWNVCTCTSPRQDNGSYRCMYVPVEAAAASKLVLHVSVNGEAAAGSPFSLAFAQMQLFTQREPFDKVCGERK